MNSFNYRKLKSLLLAFFLFTGVYPVKAQTTLSGVVSGQVYEIQSTPAVQSANRKWIQGAIVTITSNTVGFSRSVVTNSTGEYSFRGLAPGVYTITAICEGFEPSTEYSSNENLVVISGQISKVSDKFIGLQKKGTVVQPSGLQTPTTSGGGQLENSVDGTRAGVLDSRSLTSLPINGVRTFDAFSFLFPGVFLPPQPIGSGVGPGIGAGIGTSGQLSVNGHRSRSNNFTVDGSDNNDEDIGVRRQGFTSLNSQPIEAVQEFQVTTSLVQSQFGRNLGGQVNANTQGGRKEFHGTVFGFFTDRRLISRDPFDFTGGPSNFPLRRAIDNAQVQVGEQNANFNIVNLRPLAPENPVGDENPFTRVQAGFVFGGPLWKQTSNFLVTYEKQKMNASREAHFAVPKVAQRGLFGLGDQGIFANRFGALLPTSFQGDFFFSLYPFRNNPRGPFGENTFTQVLPASARGDVFSVRIDHRYKIYERDSSLTGRFNFSDDDTFLPVTGEALFSSVRPQTRNQNLSIYNSTEISPKVSNEFRFSFGRTSLNFKSVPNPLLLPSRLFPDTPFLLNRPVLGNATFPNSFNGALGTPTFITYFPQNLRETESQTGPLGQMSVSGFSPVGVDVFNLPQSRANNTFQVADTYLVQSGRQRFITGFDIRRTQLNSRLDRNFRPSVVFNGAPNLGRLSINGNPTTAPPFLSGADFIATSTPTGFFQTQALTPDSRIGLRFLQNNFFFSDQIQVSPNFTLTLGIRYELNTVPSEINRRIENTFTSQSVNQFILVERNRQNGRSGLEAFLAGRKEVYSIDLNNFSPHLGFAWRPFPGLKTIIRGGFSVGYDQILGSVISQSRNVFPSFISVNVPAFLSFNSFLMANVLGFSNPASFASSGSLNSFDGVRFGNPVNFITNGLPSSGTTNPTTGPTFVLPNANLKTPFSRNWNLTIEHAFLNDYLVSISYVGSQGRNLHRFSTPNLGPNAIPNITDFSSAVFVFTDPLFTGSVSAPNRPFPVLGAITSIESDAVSEFHSLQIQGQKRFSNGFQFTASYAWSHAIDQVSDLFSLAGSEALPQNSFDFKAEQGNASFDTRHRFSASFVWDLPFGKTNKFFGGFQLAGIVNAQTGQPFTVNAPFDINRDGNLTDRLDSTNGLTQVENGPQRLIFNGSLQSVLAATGSNGRIGRNTFRGRGLGSFDLSVNKTFKFTERNLLTLRAEIFNLFNRANYGLPIRQLGFPGFGSSVDTRISQRTMQMVLKFQF